MSTYRVFLGAPSLAEIRNDPSSYSWRTFTSGPNAASHKTLSRKSTIFQEDATGDEVPFPSKQQDKSLPVIFPSHILEAASEKISMMYKDITFGGGDEDEEQLKESYLEIEGDSGEEVLLRLTKENRNDTSSQDADSVSLKLSTEISKGEDPDQEVEISVFRGVEQTTVFSWPPSADDVSARETDASRSRIHRSIEAPSFFLSTQSISAKASQSFRKTQQDFQTQTQPESQSFGPHSSMSSIANFPSFYFSLHTVASLSSLAASVPGPGTKGKLTRKVNLVLVVLEIEGPDTIKIKNGAEAGKEVSLLKLILGDEEGSVCKLAAWREIAEEWGGSGEATGAKRGDVVYLENVMATCEPTTSISISASSYLKSSLTICYRAMPHSHEDGRLRPDLRLGISEPCVRKVANVVHWFERTAGLAG